MEIHSIESLSDMKKNKSNSKKGKKKELFIEEKEEREMYDYKTRETCVNCKHRAGSAICLSKVDNNDELFDNWCKLYEPKEDRGTIICAECELYDTCLGTTNEGKCVKYIKRKNKEKKLEELAEEGKLKVKRSD